MIKKSKFDKSVMWVFFAAFIAYAVTLLFPFLFCLINSFKTQREFNFENIWGLPKIWYFDNWVKSFDMKAYGLTIPQMYVNSIIITGVCTFLSVFSCSCTGYILTKYNFKGKSIFYSAALVIMMIPSMGSMAAQYRIYNDLNLINTYFGIFITSLGGFGIGFLMLYGFFKNVSWTYAEAALVDGAGHFRIFFKIMIPMAMPAIVAVAILQGIGIWNDFFTVYMYAPEKATIAVGLQQIAILSTSKGNYTELFAAMMFSVLPIIIIFAFFQNMIMKNTAVGGIKG